MAQETELTKTDVNNEYAQLISCIGTIINSSGDTVARQVNTTMLETYWQIGRYIVEDEQKGEARAVYGTGLLERLSQDLTLAFGKGFGRTNLTYMRKFFIAFPICGTLSRKLSWGHYDELLKIDSPKDSRIICSYPINAYLCSSMNFE